MKLSRGFWLSLAVVVLLVAGVWLFMQYNSANNSRSSAETKLSSAEQMRGQLLAEQAELNSQLAEASAAVQQWQIDIAVLEDGLRQAQDGLAQAQSELPGDINSIDYDEMLLGFARASGLEVIWLETSQPDSVEVQGNAGFAATAFTLDIKGTVPQVLDLYNRIVSDFAFRTGQIESVSIDVPLPMTDAEKAQLAEQVFNELLTELKASLSAEERVVLAEQAVMDLLDEPYDHMTVAEMTERIEETMGAMFGPDIAGRLSAEMALALEEEVADSLVGFVADVYGEMASQLFLVGDPELTPVISGLLGPEITEMLRQIPVNSVRAVVSNLIADKLYAMMDDRVVSLVDTTEVDRRVAEAAAEKAEEVTAHIILMVTAYEGGGDGES
jgi:hypothetical protein